MHLLARATCRWPAGLSGGVVTLMSDQVVPVYKSLMFDFERQSG